MSSVRVLSPRDSLIDAVLELLPTTSDDYSSSLILFQGKRPAHFLRKALALRRGKACIPPKIFSLESFVDYCYRDLLGLDAADISPLDAMGLLFEEHCSMQERIGGESFLRLESFYPLGLRILDALEELRLHRVAPSALRAALPLSDFPSADRLAALYDAFYRRLEAEGSVSYAMKAGVVADRISEIAEKSLENALVAGFFSFTPVEQTVIMGLAAREGATFLFQNGPGLKHRMDALGMASTEELPHFEMPEVQFVRAQGTHGEIFGLNRLLITPSDAPPMDERTVIVLPSADALFPVMEWTLPLIPEGNFNVSLGYPAQRTPTYGFLESLVHLLDTREGDQFYVPDYLRFVLHPYTKNLLINGHPEPNRILFHEIEFLLAGRAGNPFISLEFLEQNTALLTTVAEQSKEYDPALSAEMVAEHLRSVHDLFLRRTVRAGTLGACAESLRDILTFVDDHSAARQHTLFRRFVAEMMEALDALRSSKLGAYTETEHSSYGRLVLHALQRVHIPFPGTPVQGLQVLGLLETRNLRFDHVVVLDVNDEVLPGSPDVDPMLPVAVRAALKLPLPFERQEAIDHYFTVLLAGARKATLFYKEGVADRRSRFIERMIWSGEKQQNAQNAVDPAIRVSMEVSAANRTPVALAKTSEDMRLLRTMNFSATALDAYLRCQLQFYYANVLGLRERPEADPEIDPRGIGTILHEVMSALDIRSLGTTIPAGQDRSEDLAGALDRIFAERFGPNPSIPLVLMKTQMQKQIARYLRWYSQAVLSAGPVALEGVEVPLTGKFDGVRLSGRADRIERRGPRRVIIDFKKGAKSEFYRAEVDKLDPDDRETWSEAMRSVQLPFYLLMSVGDQDDVDTVDPVYVFLGSLRDDMFEIPLFAEGTDRRQAWSKITGTFSRLFHEILDSEQPFRPPADLGKVCPDCAFRVVCGTGWVEGRG
ncbi:MAG TPA: PD-(D/E)XK nuclease family protein [Bacteroidota bacterium]|nr:PD-(D/E)XK nuclease family protein [Bacteroidota bacterium]